jgi:pimeloyl-ACP methyl ester carboxylesterase
VILYLHGFASSPQSSKAAFLARKLAERGLTLRVPDFNEPDFSTLTVTRMIDQVWRVVDEGPPEPVTVIGSSLGGFVAVNAAVQRPERVDRLVLLAPALDFGDSSIGEPERETITVFHYGHGRTMPVHYALYDDARRYDAFNADVRMPVLVFQGRRDDAVDPHSVERWCRQRPNVELHMIDDNHQLTASLPRIWEVTSRFLDIAPQSPAAPS